MRDINWGKQLRRVKVKEPEKADEPLDHKACGTPAEDRAQEGGLGEERVAGSTGAGKIWASEDSLSPRCP